MPLSVAELQPVLQDLFVDSADELARATGFCQRARKLTGSVFAQALVFTLLNKPDASLDDFAEAAEDSLDTPVSAQAFDQRFNEPAAAFMQELFLQAFNYSFTSLRPALLPLLRRFPAVFVRDATLVSLPSCLARFFPGRGGRHAPHGQAAAVKLVLEAEITSGAFTELSILAGLDNERTAEVANKPLPEGALLLEDMGFLSGERLQWYIDQGVIVVTRIPAWTAVFDEKGTRLDLVKELRKAKGWRYERPVQIMQQSKVKVRLVAVRVPEQEAEKRRERVCQEAKKRGRPVSQKKLDMCEWNIVVTNATAELLSAEEACLVRRVRWQIELVFMVFKSEGEIDQTRSQKAYRVMCELYAKMLGQVVQQWTLLAAGHEMLRHSARRAARRVRQVAFQLLKGIKRFEKLQRAVARLAKVLHQRCRIGRRHKTPSTLDRLIACDPRFDEGLRIT